MVGTLRRRQEQAFTLVEVLVALAIVAFALPALMGQISSQVNHTAYLRDRAMAQWVAQNRLEEVQLEYKLTQRLLKGSASGEEEMAGRTWYWEVRSETTAVPGMWRETVVVGDAPDVQLATAVGFIAEVLDEEGAENRE